jgi:hypothetical protein
MHLTHHARLLSLLRRCGAHARALQYYESHVRAERKGGLNPAAARTSVEYKDEQVGCMRCPAAVLRLLPARLHAC